MHEGSLHASSYQFCLQKGVCCGGRYADKLAAAHDDEHLAKFEELLEAAIDLDRIPDEYLICASYDSDLQVSFLSRRHLDRQRFVLSLNLYCRRL